MRGIAKAVLVVFVALPLITMLGACKKKAEPAGTPPPGVQKVSPQAGGQGATTAQPKTD